MSEAISTAPWNGLFEDLHPKQRLFISFDAINSTGWKTEAVNGEDSPTRWGAPLHYFFDQIPGLFQKKLDDVVKKYQEQGCFQNEPRSKHCKKECCNTFKIMPWKYIGDEIVFMAELKCINHPLYILEAALDVIENNNKECHKNKNSDPVDYNKPVLCYKGTAWTAGFPTANLEISILSQERDKMIPDYVGPSIDLGFRLSNFSTEERFVLSTSLVFLLRQSYLHQHAKNLRICSSGNMDIKGVKYGVHPLFWLSVPSYSASKTKNKRPELLHSPNETEFDNFFSKYFNEDDRPFILDGGGETYSEKYKEKFALEYSKSLLSPNTKWKGSVRERRGSINLNAEAAILLKSIKMA